MSAESFVDTNVLLYAAAGKLRYPQKHRIAWLIIGAGNYAISGQVLAEFYVNSQKTKVTQTALTQKETSAWIERLCLAPIVPIEARVVQQAINYSNRFQISYWDAALIAAAETRDIVTLYTEDLNHGQFYGTVQAINPFLTQSSGLQEQ